MILPASFSLLAQALGWTVVHSLWQIAIIWIIFKALSWVLRGRNQVIYLLSLASMLASALWCSATFLAEYARLAMAAQAEVSAENLSAPAVFTTGNESVPGLEILAPTWLETGSAWLESHTVQVGWAWLICVALLWVRLFGGWWLVQRLRRRDVVAPDSSFQQQCAALCKQLKINTMVQLLESPHVVEPLTLGFWKPVILFPVGMLLSLSPTQVEALMLHELAHIRRYDYGINLLQLALETCFFYHPLFWLISRDARVRREFCCDDVVLQHTCDPILYAKTLTDLQLLLLHPTTQFTMNATGKSRFTERILRIAGITPSRESRPNWLIVLLLPTFIAICSWWPAQAVSRTLDIALPDKTTTMQDTLPPRKTVSPTPTVPVAKMDVTPTAPNIKPSSDQVAPSPKVAMEVVKMNVFYIGVDNPIRVAVEGVPTNELILKLEGKGTISGGDGNYNVVVSQPGEVIITILRLQGNVETPISHQKYRVKRIPDPAPMIGNTFRGGVITKEKLLEAKGIQAVLVNFDFDAFCEVVGFKVTILPKAKMDALTVVAYGPDLPQAAREYVEKLSGDGDAIFFDDIKVKCPGDAAARNIGSMACKLAPETGRE